MLALVIVLTAAIVLLGVLVVGLLRSHADILIALHRLGVGVGDPASPGTEPLAPAPVAVGMPLPPERAASSAPDVAGVTPGGDALAVAVGSGRGDTLLAFLSSGCGTCEEFWQVLASPGATSLPPDLRLVVVTRGPELESPEAVVARGVAGAPVVMSTEAWRDYEVPGSPFFALVDGRSGRRVGEGLAGSMGQVVDLVTRARRDGGAAASVPKRETRLDGPGREQQNDLALLAAGIGPGDPSLYPRSLPDVLAPTVASDPGPSR